MHPGPSYGTDEAAARAELAARLAGARVRIDDFARSRLGLLGAARLNGAALGPDLLRAPLNVLLSPLLAVCRLLGALLSLLRLRRAGRWLSSRNFLLRTDVSRRLESLIRAELLGLGPDTPPLPPRLEARVAACLAEYAGSRAAVAELTVALATLAAGAFAFHALTPGMVSLGPNLAEMLAREQAIAGFPLGDGAGAVWYGLFPPDASPLRTVGVTLALIVAGSVAAAFAGVLADPLQTLIGLHQRRLRRLIDGIEAALEDDGNGGYRAREHYAARLIDLADAGLGVLRNLRG